MDSITQLALGGAIGTALLGRRVGRRAALLGALCATLPDLDALIPRASAVAEVTYHRGLSHSVLFLTALTPLLVWLILRLRAGAGASWREWAVLVWLALITHALLDSLTIYGTQLLLPFADTPIAWGTIFIIDPLYSLPLIAGLLAYVATGSRRGLRLNAIGLAVSTAYLAFSVAAKLHVQRHVADALDRQQLEYRQFMTVPTPFNSILWRIVVIDDDSYHEGFYSLFDGSAGLEMRSYPNRHSLLRELDGHWPVERLVWFTRGYYAVREQDCKIVIVDLRMGQEPHYFFSFVVGRRLGADVLPSPDRRLEVQADARGVLRWIWRRIWREQPPRVAAERAPVEGQSWSTSSTSSWPESRRRMCDQDMPTASTSEIMISTE